MSIKQLCERMRKDVLSHKEKYIRYFMTMVCLLLLTRMFTNLAYGSAQAHQTFKDYLYYKGIALFLVVLVLVRKVSFLNVPMLAVMAVYVIAAVKRFVADFLGDAYGAELRNALVAKCVAWGFFLIILVDVIRTGKRACFSKGNKVFVCMAMIAFSGALAMSLEQSLCLLCPFAALYLTPISKKQWNWLVDCLTVAYYGSFVWVMAKMLITVPYTAENIRNGYYFGFFQSPWSVGIYCAGAFVCTTYWFVRLWSAEKRELIKLGVCVVMMVFPVYTTLIAASRSAEIGILGCALFAFIFATSKTKSDWKKRGIGVLIVASAAVVCGMILLFFLSGIDPDSIHANWALSTHVRRWAAIARKVFTGESAYLYFPKGSVLSAIDEMMSNRLCILVETLKNVTLFGREDLSVLVGDVYFHPHNSYAAWLLMYGWLGGIPMIMWFFGFIVQSARGVLKREVTSFFPLLWGGFLAFALLPDYLPWMYPAAFILFFVQYPFLIGWTEGGDGYGAAQQKQGTL